MSSAVARPMRSSSKKLTSSKTRPFLDAVFVSRCSGWFRCVARSDPLFDLGLLGPAGVGLTRRAAGSDLLDRTDAFVGAAGQVDAELLRGAEHVLVGVAHV